MRGVVDRAGAVRLAGTSPPACFAGRSWQRRRVSHVCVTDERGLDVSEREGERTESFGIF